MDIVLQQHTDVMKKITEKFDIKHDFEDALSYKETVSSILHWNKHYWKPKDFSYDVWLFYPVYIFPISHVMTCTPCLLFPLGARSIFRCVLWEKTSVWETTFVIKSLQLLN